MSHGLAFVVLFSAVVSKHTLQLWKDAILTAFQCRAVDLEINSCKSHRSHYTWKKGPQAFHDKVALIKCDHDHHAHVEAEEDHDHEQHERDHEAEENPNKIIAPVIAEDNNSV